MGLKDLIYFGGLFLIGISIGSFHEQFEYFIFIVGFGAIMYYFVNKG